MEYFTHAKYIRLRSHHNKYLIAGSDGLSIKQSRDGKAMAARWAVELVPDKPNTVRLRGCHDKLLTASSEPFLLGWTGKKALQTGQDDDVSVEWEPIGGTDKGHVVKLRAAVSGKYLRGNFRAPPWRNSVTVDLPEVSATREWVMWVVVVDDDDEVDRCVWMKNSRALTHHHQGRRVKRIGFRSSTDAARCSMSSSSTEPAEEEEEEEEWLDSMSTASFSSVNRPYKGGLELFRNAKTVRLRSHHDKYLVAEEKGESVIQARKGDTRRARWTVEYVNSVEGVELVRLKSCYDKYLTATDDEFLLGMTGKKVKQIMPTTSSLNSSTEWEPIREGMEVKFKTRYGNFLRANGGVPPWRNSITHDVPSASHTQDWVLWEVDVLQLYPKVEPIIEEIEKPQVENLEFQSCDSENDELVSVKPPIILKPGDIGADGVKNKVGRVIYYNMVDDEGNVEEGEREGCLVFRGNGVKELRQSLEQETGLKDITLCLRSRLDDKLYPMRLALPPNHDDLHVYVVPSSSQGPLPIRNLFD